MATAIKFEDVSKQYRLGQIGTGTISRDLERAWARLRGKPDPFAKIGEVNNREIAGGDYVWALKDVNFRVEEGEVLGIIGRNGAGKSTLLKLLSRVTAPTTGEIKARGRIASLLEVGTGFHPELTGRENIFLNGAILGMTRREVKARLDEIVEFSGCAKYIDTPVKRYSSGMTVRLGFSVAAHLECEILVVDEVLAVGDVEFQKKCIGKMQQMSSENGRTVLFVSHQLGSVKRLCRKAAWIRNGCIVKTGDVNSVIEDYVSSVDKSVECSEPSSVSVDGFSFKSVEITNRHAIVFSAGQLSLRIHYESSIEVQSPAFVVQIHDSHGTELLRLSTLPISGFRIDQLYQEGVIELDIPMLPFVPGLYSVDVGLVEERLRWILKVENAVRFGVEEFDCYGSGFCLNSQQGRVVAEHSWKHKDARP